MDEDAAELLRVELGLGERLLWAGRPPSGLLLRPVDAFLIPFSVLWSAFIVYWETLVLSGVGPRFFALWGLLFVAMGAYLLVGRFFMDAHARARTRYGVTDERVLIARGGISRRITSLPLRTLGDVAVDLRRDGSGTITFGTASAMQRWQGTAWPGTGRYTLPSFERIPRAREVYNAIRRAQRGT